MLGLAYIIPTGLPFRLQQIPSSCVLFMLGFMTKNVIKNIAAKKFMDGFHIKRCILRCLNMDKRFERACCAQLWKLLFVVLGRSIQFCNYYNDIIHDARSSNRVIEFYGRNSMTVMCCHYIIARHLIPFIFREIGIEELLTSAWIEIILAVVTMLLMYPVCIFINHHAKVLLGQYEYKWLNKLCEKIAAAE